MVSAFLFYLCIQCSSASNNAKRTNVSGLAHTGGPECKKAKNEDDIFFTIPLNVNGVQKQVKFHAKVTQSDNPDIYKYSIRSNSTISKDDLVFIAKELKNIAQIKIENDQINAKFDCSKEIFSNHIQQTNEDEQDMPHKIETSKNIKKNTKNFIDLSEEMKKPLLEQLTYKQSKYEKLDKLKKYMRDKKIYTIKNFMKQNVIITFNLAEIMPECLAKYSRNKKIFDKQTETIRKMFDTGVIDFDEFYSVIDKEIEYGDDDKETLAKLVDIQMNDFLHKNINSLTLLFPKMQFFYGILQQIPRRPFIFC